MYKLQTIKSGIGKVFISVTEIMCYALFNYRKVYTSNRRRAIILLLAWLIILGSLLYLSVTSWLNPLVTSTLTENSSVNKRTLPAATGSENFFIDQLSTGIKSTASIFDGFIANTSDPTGRAICHKEASPQCQLSIEPVDKLTFPITDASLTSTNKFVEVLNGLVIPLAFILISLQGFNHIMAETKEDLKSFLFRIGGVLALMILTPYIISISIIAVNQLSYLLLGNLSLTDFILDYIKLFEVTAPENDFQKLLFSILELGNSGGINPLSYLYALPVIIPVGLLLILLLFITFQFILRYLNLYFLAAVYPLVMVFGLHPQTAGIVRNFWRQWTTFLIQQPVFVFGFVIIQEILKDNLGNGLSLESLILFLGMLLFLCSVNLLASRLWGDAYASVTQNVAAGLAATSLKQALVDRPLEYGRRLVGLNPQNDLISQGKKFLETDLGQDAAKSSNSGRLKKARAHAQSPLMRELAGSGFQVDQKEGGQLKVSGNFYHGGLDDTKNSSVLYTSALDAIKDGHNREALQTIPINGLNIQDTSNKKMTMRYNDSVRDTAAENNGHAKDIGLSYRSNDKKVARSMQIAKSTNLLKGIQAIGVKNEPALGDKTILGDNIIKIHVYPNVLRNSNA